MKLFDNLFNKARTKEYTNDDVVAPVSGTMISPGKIQDSIFSKEMLGQTIGIEPTDNIIVSPVNGTIETLFSTGHAFGVKTAEGNGFLVHIGIDTVSMRGQGFKTFAKQADTVKAGQKIVSVNLEKVSEMGHMKTVMLILTEKGKKDYQVNYIENTKVEKGQKINL